MTEYSNYKPMTPFHFKEFVEKYPKLGWHPHGCCVGCGKRRNVCKPVEYHDECEPVYISNFKGESAIERSLKVYTSECGVKQFLMIDIPYKG
ncbi:MAG: hypothetical protein KDH96_07535 [Candidatus Riesia sp.]|nr:hypothetical protein [Candidatus Riesia sp.]